jgi:hypothetical protein
MPITFLPSTGGGGTSDHGSLTGLSDDDHTQYHNNARGDLRYPSIAALTAVQTTATNAASAASDAYTLADQANDAVALTKPIIFLEEGAPLPTDTPVSTVVLRYVDA